MLILIPALAIVKAALQTIVLHPVLLAFLLKMSVAEAPHSAA
jgi:hypothetical protein